ncbi:hypothetical protein GCM10009551_080210 [Nocardiopsis tropica]
MATAGSCPAIPEAAVTRPRPSSATSAVRYSGTPPGSFGGSHIWITRATVRVARGFCSRWLTPVPALIAWICPARTSPLDPDESSWWISPATTQVTISASRWKCRSTPAPGSTRSSLCTRSWPCALAPRSKFPVKGIDWRVYNPSPRQWVRSAARMILVALTRSH